MNTAEQVLAQMAALPLHRYLGIGCIKATDGRAHFEIQVGEHSANPNGALHGGVVCTLCDVACYAALQNDLADDEDAVTHDIHVSVMRAARTGDTVRFEATVIKRGRSLAFVEAQAYCGDKLMASARVTKSILRTG